MSEWQLRVSEPVDAHKAVVERARGAALALVELLEAVVGVRDTGKIVCVVNVVPHFSRLQGQDKEQGNGRGQELVMCCFQK